MEELLVSLREKNPLVHCMTNYVTSNDMANVILSIGGSPIMADELEEMEDVVGLADSLLINIGTINSLKLESMIRAIKTARGLSKPVVFDPVGIGVSDFRARASLRILEEGSISLIKGNISEINYLYKSSGQQKGVDSEDFKDEKLNEYIHICKELSRKYKATIVMTGERDIIASRDRLAIIKNSTDLMEKVTGTGCILGGVMASFLGVEKDAFKAALISSLMFNIAGELARDYIVEKDLGLASFKIALIDNLFKLDYKTIERKMDVEIY